nr:hypothetical protein [Escherichia coli]
MTGTGNPFLMSYFTQTTDGRVNLMHHRKAGNTKLGSSAITVTTGRRWSWCSPPAVPRLLETEWSGWPGIPGYKRQSDTGTECADADGCYKNAAYGVEIESLVLEINAPASS